MFSWLNKVFRGIFKQGKSELKESDISFVKSHKDELQHKTYQETTRLSPHKGGKIRPKFIVLHHSAGSFSGTVNWILDKKSKVSYHYVIDPDTGDRVQMVWDSRKAWHAGKSEWKGYRGLNSYSIGIAFSGNTNKRTVEDFEIDSVAKKCIYLMRKFDLKLEDIVTHKMIAPRRKNDCSDETYHRVIKRIREITHAVALAN